MSAPEMAKLIFYALMLVLIGLIWFDNQAPCLPDKFYCVVGAGYEALYRQDASELRRASGGKVSASPRPFVSRTKVCVHGSLWDGIEAVFK
jgi:BRCT domain type II-containing protein